MLKQEIDAFIAVVQYGSLSAAAEKLYITQPALSRRIQNLESELQYKLIYREKGVRGISLTERGKAFLSVAQKWNAVYQEALAIKNLDQKPLLRVASIGSVCTYILPDIFKCFTTKDALYNLDYHSCHSWEGYSLVESGLADVAFIDYIEQPNTYAQGNVLSIPVYSVPFVFVGGAAWKDADILHPSELDPKKEILLPWNTAFEIWHKYWFNASIAPKVKLDHVTVIKDVLQDDLFAIVPKMVARHLRTINPDITVCELREGPPDEIIHCLTSLSSQQKPQVRFFMEMLKKTIPSRNDIYCLMD